MACSSCGGGQSSTTVVKNTQQKTKQLASSFTKAFQMPKGTKATVIKKR